MIPKVIKSDDDYKAALKRIDEIFDAEADSPEEEELELLVTLVEVYEDEHYPIDLPSPLEAIKFRMEQQGLTRKDLEPFIGSRARVSEVLNGKRPLSLKMIRALHKGLGIPADVLLQEEGASIPEEDTRIEWSKFPITEMYKRGWFEGFEGSLNDAKEQAEELIKGLLEPAHSVSLLTAHCRQHVRSGSKSDQYSLLAWLARVVSLTAKKKLPDYEGVAEDTDFLNNLLRLSYFDNGPALAKEYLEKHGVHLVVEKHLPRTFLDGVSMMLPGGNPLIALTCRYDRVDNFWFTLLHELAHIALHLRKDSEDCFVDDLSVENEDVREIKADKWAENTLIPPRLWQHYAGGNLREKAVVLEIAKKLGIHPAIVAGRIRKELDDYTLFSQLTGTKQVRKLFFSSN
ncbi:MAG TPA: helix-turn-helix domain-containing protein [Acidobacteriota bacterium]|nr:helix-turn-helix domain-containing protein [Acidobacteriota bacterium]